MEHRHIKNWLIFFASIFILSVFILQLLETQDKKTSLEQLPVSFLVFGDSGSGETKQKKLAQIMLSYPFNFILHTGDLAYPNGTKQQLTDNFFEVYKEHLKRGPVYPSPGNHDYLTDNLKPYLDFFNHKRYYSFDIEDTHFVSLDTNTISNEMVNWLNTDLENAKDSKWKIIFFHHPPYSSGNEHGGDLRVRNILVPIFEKYGVDIVFSGHEHNFERTCALKEGKCTENGVVYIVTGGAGDTLYDFGPEEYFTQFRASQNHFVYSAINGCKMMVETVNIDNQIIDSLTLDKCN